GGDSIGRKIECVLSNIRIKNPYREILNSKEVLGVGLKDCGEIKVESWLSIYPTTEDLPMLTTANFGAFLDSDGCREYKEKVKSYVRDLDRPLMIGIDHSLTGGVVEALKERMDDFTLVLFDSHFDGVPSPVRNGLIGYMMENSPDYERFGYRPTDYVFSAIGRKNSYNSGSFLYHLINEGIIGARDVVVFGALDYPSEKMERVQDPRVKEFVQVYKNLEEEGVTIVHRGIIDSLGVEEAINRVMVVRGKNVYVSVDLDIGSRSALMGAKFTDIEGLKEAEIYKAVGTMYWRNSNIIGLDLMELNPWTAGADKEGIRDRTYNICGNIIRILSEGRIYLDEKYKAVLKNIFKKTRIKDIKDKKALNELTNMGFLATISKYVKVVYKNEII
ncbi:MAG: arginase family protein, partial [Candidatus Methanomethylicaceae archaeon]